MLGLGQCTTKGAAVKVRVGTVYGEGSCGKG